MSFDLKQFRLERNLTQLDFHKVTKIPRSTITQIENGFKPISKKVKEKIISVYGENCDKSLKIN